MTGKTQILLLYFCFFGGMIPLFTVKTLFHTWKWIDKCNLLNKNKPLGIYHYIIYPQMLVPSRSKPGTFFGGMVQRNRRYKEPQFLWSRGVCPKKHRFFFKLLFCLRFFSTSASKNFAHTAGVCGNQRNDCFPVLPINTTKIIIDPPKW